MNDLPSDAEGRGCCPTADSATTCCQPDAGSGSSCCTPSAGTWNRGKIWISVIVIAAAIGVGVHSFLRVTSAQSSSPGSGKSFSAGLEEVPAGRATDNPQSKPQEIRLDRVIDSLQALETMAADRDVVFVVLQRDSQLPLLTVPRQVGTVVTNLWKSGQRVAVFTMKNGTPDHSQLVNHFSIGTFPSVVVLGRQGTPSAVSGDFNEARLYNAFVLASTPASCCPGQGNAACCPK